MPLTSSPETDKIDDALAKARGQYLPIEKGRTANTGKFSYDFADLADVFAATSKALADNGIAMIQDVWVGGEEVPAIFCQTKLMHTGQWYLSSVMELRIAPDGKMSTIQCIGSAETFARRYQAIAMLAVQPKGEDDDAHAAGGTDAPTEPKKERAPLPACPKCGKANSVIVGRPEYGGGFVCYPKKSDGCGHKWQPSGADPQAAKDAERQKQSGEHDQTKGPAELSQAFTDLVQTLVAMGVPKGNQEHANAVCKYGYEGSTIAKCKTDPSLATKTLDGILARNTTADPTGKTVYHHALKAAGIEVPQQTGDAQ